MKMRLTVSAPMVLMNAYVAVGMLVGSLAPPTMDAGRLAAMLALVGITNIIGFYFGQQSRDS